MNHPVRSITMLVAAMLAAAPGLGYSQEDALRPVAVLSVAPLDELIADLRYMAQSAGAGDAFRFAEIAAGEFTTGIDKTRPLGVIISMDAAAKQPEGKGVIFIPVNDFQALLEKATERFGTPAEGKNGVWKYTFGQEVYIKERAGWMFVSDDQRNFNSVPEDPSELLDALSRKYTVAIRFFIRNIPEPLLNLAKTEIKSGLEQSLASGLRGQNDVEQQLAAQMTRDSLQSLVTMIEETDQVTVGWAVDDQAKRTFVDVSVTAIEGTRFAQQMASYEDNTSSFAGFLLPDAAITFNSSGRLTDDERRQMLGLVQALEQQVLDELDDAARRSAVEKVMAVGRGTIEQGELDFGGACIIEPSAVSFAIGARVSDGAALRVAFDELIELAKSSPEIPEIKIESAQHRDVQFQTLRIPLPNEEAEARRLLGDTLEVTVGTGPTSFYLAFGKDCHQLVTRAIDQSVVDAGKMVPPAQVKIALLPILRFISNVNESEELADVINRLQQSPGRDHLLITTASIPNGLGYRFEVEEGILGLIGGWIDN